MTTSGPLVAGLAAAVRSGRLSVVRLLVLLVHRVRVGIVLFGVAVRAGAGVVGRLGERVLEVAQPVGCEIEGFHVRAGLPQGPAAPPGRSPPRVRPPAPGRRARGQRPGTRAVARAANWTWYHCDSESRYAPVRHPRRGEDRSQRLSLQDQHCFCRWTRTRASARSAGVGRGLHAARAEGAPAMPGPLLNAGRDVDLRLALKCGLLNLNS